MSKPKKLLKKIIIAVFSESSDWANNAKIGIFIDSLVTKPVHVFDQVGTWSGPHVTDGELKIANKIKELMTENYNWEVIFSEERKILKVDEKTVSFLNPKEYINMFSLQRKLA